MKVMNSKNTTLIATIVAVILCGCPGLLGLCFGLTSLFASFVPGAQIDVFGSSDPQSATTMGLVTLCLSVIFIAVPIVTWFVMRRREAASVSDNEPLPPAV
jgi:preprotein translocase subunit SecF